MLWPLLLPIFLQQPDPPSLPAAKPVSPQVEIEVVEAPSPLVGAKHTILRVSGSTLSTLIPSGGLAGLELEMSSLYRRLRSSSVEVTIQFVNDAEEPRLLITSGVILDNFGLFVVPVVWQGLPRGSEKEKITVYRTDGQMFQAELVAWNVDYGISLLRAKELRGLAPEFGHGLWMEEGSVTIGLGHPFGLPNSMSLGFVTGRQRGIGSAGGLLQITNPVNIGDRGGLLANRHGQVVAMMLISLADAAREAEENLKLYVAEFGNDSVEGAKQAQGISFALPVEKIFSIFPEQFKRNAIPSRVFGVLVENQILVIENPGQEPCHTWAVVVKGLMPQSPAEVSGLMPGDVVLSLGGLATPSSHQLGVAIISAPQSTTIVVQRGGKELELPLEFDL
jgi:S1-C subfamily serine protease